MHGKRHQILALFCSPFIASIVILGQASFQTSLTPCCAYYSLHGCHPLFPRIYLTMLCINCSIFRQGHLTAQPLSSVVCSRYFFIGMRILWELENGLGNDFSWICVYISTTRMQGQGCQTACCSRLQVLACTKSISS